METHDIQYPDGHPARRKHLRALGFVLLLLGVAVFAWGLRYKLSLYDSPHSMARHMPEAKLLTGKERTPVSAAEILQSGTPRALATLTGFSFSFLLLLGAVLSLLAGGWALPLIPGLHVPRRTVTAAHFIRPPPRVY